MDLRLDQSSGTPVPTVQHHGRVLLTAPAAVDLLVDGAQVRLGYQMVQTAPGRLVGSSTVSTSAAVLEVHDTWQVVDAHTVRLSRRLRATREVGVTRAAVQLRLELALAAEEVRFFAPGMAYVADQWADGVNHCFADHRLAYPVVAAHLPEGLAVSLEREHPARYDAAPQRAPGQSVFPQATDVGSVGLRGGVSPALHAAWPYAEVASSAMLDAERTPAVALHPVPDEGLDVTIDFLLRAIPAARYSDAVRAVFGATVARLAPEPSPLAVTLRQSIALRLDSAARSWTRFDDGFAGFVLNIDPDLGYDSQARAFGASFADHHMGGSRTILEYGFTGRQLNLAYMLARRSPTEWSGRACAVVDSFVERMTMPSGWVHTLWDAGRGRPLFACGDEAGPVMHYLGSSRIPGTYTRMMCEAGSDLLLNVDLRGRDDPAGARWRSAAVRLADFLLRVQEPDGAWYRAYTPDGHPITDDRWFGSRGGTGRSATAVVVPFLLDLADRVADPEPYVAAAQRAAQLILREQSEADDYRGGTLDNPNVVDKEAAFLAMRALYALHRRRPAPALLEAARRAAVLAVTWHSIWEVPAIPGTRLAEERVRSVGWGGINPIWGVGVTDIYSLFFLADLHRLGVEVGDDLFVRIAELAAHASVQILGGPGDLHGFADTGMQPEGIAFCPQGMDDGLIAKGDTWGGLAWPYTAGSYALDCYLTAREGH